MESRPFCWGCFKIRMEHRIRRRAKLIYYDVMRSWLKTRRAWCDVQLVFLDLALFFCGIIWPKPKNANEE